MRRFASPWEAESRLSGNNGTKSHAKAGVSPHAAGCLVNDCSQRAAALASQAIQAGQPWVRRLGPPPADPVRRAAWEQQVRTVTAYRDRHGITGSDPLGPAPSGRGQRLDHQRADAACRRAQVAAHEDVRRRHGPWQQIDSGRDLSR